MQDRLFSDVQTLGEAEKILRDNNINWMGTFQFTYPERHPAHLLKNKGIHIYFQNGDRNDIAYYTPHMESMMIFAEPRVVDAGFNTMGEFKINHVAMTDEILAELKAEDERIDCRDHADCDTCPANDNVRLCNSAKKTTA